jgi:hypothetical protein
MAATKTIKNTFSHIIIEDSSGSDQRVSIPKANLTIVRRIGEDSVEKIWMNWSSGNKGRARDWYKLTYDEVTYPSVSSNQQLELLLRALSGTPTYLIADLNLHVVDHYAIIGNQNAVFTLVYEDGSPRSDLAGSTLTQGVPLFSGLEGGGMLTSTTSTTTT